MSEPQTDAGRALLVVFAAERPRTTPENVVIRHAVTRIEAEAAAAERARLAAAVEGLHVTSLVGMTGDASVDNYVTRAAVLALLREERE